MKILDITKNITLLNSNSLNYRNGFNYQIETTIKFFNLKIFKKISFSK